MVSPYRSRSHDILMKSLWFTMICSQCSSGAYAFCEWHMDRFRLLCKKIKIKPVTPLGKAVWRLSSLMALPLAEILYHHTPHPPYLLPGRLVLLSISSLAPKCPSIICHAIFSPAALTPGLLFPCLLLLHISLFSPPKNSPLSLSLGITL